jgi:hypothetical protein
MVFKRNLVFKDNCFRKNQNTINGQAFFSSGQSDKVENIISFPPTFTLPEIGHPDWSKKNIFF